MERNCPTLTIAIGTYNWICLGSQIYKIKRSFEPLLLRWFFWDLGDVCALINKRNHHLMSNKLNASKMAVYFFVMKWNAWQQSHVEFWAFGLTSLHIIKCEIEISKMIRRFSVRQLNNIMRHVFIQSRIHRDIKVSNKNVCIYFDFIWNSFMVLLMKTCVTRTRRKT